MRQLLLTLCMAMLSTFSSAQPYRHYKPVNRHTDKQTRELLERLYRTADEGKIMSGLHHNQLHMPNYRHDLDRIDQAVPGAVPMVWGGDVAWDADKVVRMATEHHRKGYVISITWHAARPFDKGTVDFKRQTQGRFSDEQWEELVTEGSEMHRMWMAQVDSIAGYLKQLQENHVPVLWRPFHEMNGDWFWWCNRKGEKGFTVLWKMLYHRLTDYHKLNILIWVWNPNNTRKHPVDHEMGYELYYPGDKYVDVLAADVYHREWFKDTHDQLVELGKGKLVALGEVGELPTAAQLEAYNKYAWFMVWTSFTDDRYNTLDALKDVFGNGRVLNLPSSDEQQKTKDLRTKDKRQPAMDRQDKLPLSSGRKASFCNGDVDDLQARFTDFTDTPETKMGIHFRGLKAATEEQRRWLEDATAEPDSLKKDACWQERDIRLYPYNAPLPADVNQSALGDCNVLSLLGEMAYLYPRFILHLIKQESPRSFRVRMFDPKGLPIVVRVSNKCLTNPKGEIIQCKGKEGIPTWSTILEKAIMKWLKVYKPGTSIEGFGAELMTPLFTGDGRSFSIHPGALSATELQRLVLTCLRHGVLVNGGFLRSDVPLDHHVTISMHGHTFMMPQRPDALFAVRNPWGHGEDDHVMNVTDDGIVPPLIDLRIISPGIALKYFKGEPKPYFSPIAKEVRKEETTTISRKGWKLTWQDDFDKGKLDASISASTSNWAAVGWAK